MRVPKEVVVVVVLVGAWLAYEAYKAYTYKPAWSERPIYGGWEI